MGFSRKFRADATEKGDPIRGLPQERTVLGAAKPLDLRQAAGSRGAPAKTLAAPRIVGISF